MSMHIVCQRTVVLSLLIQQTTDNNTSEERDPVFQWNNIRM
jgi:hypothetical protein